MRLPNWFLALSFVVALAALGVSLVRPLLTREPHELVLTDSAGHPRIVLSARNGGGRIELVDADGKPRAVLHQDGENVALEIVPDADSAAIRLRATEKGPEINLRNATSHHSVDLLAGSTGDSGMIVVTPKSMLATTSSATTTSVLMRSGEQRTDLTTTDDGSSLEFGRRFPTMVLRHSPSDTSLQLTPPRTVGATVQLFADAYGASMHLNRSPRTGSAPIQFAVTKDEGVSLTVEGKELRR